MYKVTATLYKPGGHPVQWIRYTKTKLTKNDCKNIVNDSKYRKEPVEVSDFAIESVKQPALFPSPQIQPHH